MGCCNGPAMEAPIQMTPADREALYALLAQMRTLHSDLAENHAGICVLHLDAAIAALESHLRRGGVSLIEELREGLASMPVAETTQSAAE